MGVWRAPGVRKVGNASQVDAFIRIDDGAAAGLPRHYLFTLLSAYNVTHGELILQIGQMQRVPPQD